MAPRARRTTSGYARVYDGDMTLLSRSNHAEARGPGSGPLIRGSSRWSAVMGRFLPHSGRRIEASERPGSEWRRPPSPAGGDARLSGEDRLNEGEALHALNYSRPPR